MGNIKISVIIAIYNVDKYLDKCLNSVVNQTYRSLEIICVDDGSVDNSGKICDEYAVKDSRIKVIHKENGGECSARNVGLEVATGDYISLIDGDDWLELTMYEVLLNNISGDDIDISSCGYFKDYGDRTEVIKNELLVSEEPMPMKDFLKYIYIRDKYRGVASYLWCKLINRKIFDERKIRFREDMLICHDQIVASECYMGANRIVYTSKPLYHYLQRENSAVHDARRRLKNVDACRAYEYIIDLYKKNNIDSFIIDYVKRFYVYHSSVLLKLAFENRVEYSDKIDILKRNIKKYIDVYCRTNKEYPERIEEVYKLLDM